MASATISWILRADVLGTGAQKRRHILPFKYRAFQLLNTDLTVVKPVGIMGMYREMVGIPFSINLPYLIIKHRKSTTPRTCRQMSLQVMCDDFWLVHSVRYTRNTTIYHKHSFLTTKNLQSFGVARSCFYVSTHDSTIVKVYASKVL